MIQTETATPRTGTCPLCSHSGTMLPRFPEKEIVQCPKCDLVYYARVAQHAAHELYDETYFQNGEYIDYVADKALAQRNFSHRIRELRKLKPSGKLLEIGCAYGFFLEMAKEHWDARGIDVTAEGTRYAREKLGLDARQGDFLEQPDEPGAYDLICMWDTIEHLAEPFRYIEKASKWLKPGGLLVMTTGNIGSAMARMRGEKWRLIHPPTHLYYFTPQTLGKACERAGLRVHGVSHPGYTRSSRSMLKAVFDKPGSSLRFVYPLFSMGGKLDLPVYLNLFDIMMLTARKPA